MTTTVDNTCGNCGGQIGKSFIERMIPYLNQIDYFHMRLKIELNKLKK